METTYLAIDIGASSGRVMQSQLLADGTLSLEEVHRFKNGFSHKAGHDRWAMEELIQELLIGLQKVKKAGIEKCYVGIDTWAVDYCLVDSSGELVSEPIAYRDQRTNGAMESFSERYSLKQLYEKTGIQLQPFNTIFQLFVEDQQQLKKADKLLLIPDYLGYVFTGKAVMEQTNASTMQLLNAGTKEWEPELLAILQISRELFPPLVEAGTVLGPLLQRKFPAFDLPDATFITIASHDTASAIIGTPGKGENWAYLSSGTWSLLGIETTVAKISHAAFSANYTNEWGAHNTFRFLKNIMGMWLIQEVARMQEYQYSYPELAQLAEETPAFQQFIAVNDPLFLNPENMSVALQDYCRKTNQKVPQTPGEIARCIYDNLALCYSLELEKLENLTGTANKIEKLHIVGGGSNNKLLNQLTANAANITVEAGPAEATAIGNILLQMLTTGEMKDLVTARAIVEHSFDCCLYQADPIDPMILKQYKTFLEGVENT